MRYDYLKNITEDVKNYIKENYETIEEVNKEQLYGDLFIEDSVTGNASGSYTFNTWMAEEFLCHNIDLLKEACGEFCCDIPDGAEAQDVTIRCYLLGEAIEKAIEELEEESEAE